MELRGENMKSKLLSLFLVFVMVCVTPAFAETSAMHQTSETQIMSSDESLMADSVVQSHDGLNNTTKRSFEENLGNEVLNESDNVVYVDSVNGDDNNTGSILKPKKTIKEALKGLKENASIVLAGGQYLENNITIDKCITIVGQMAEIISTQFNIIGKNVKIRDLIFKNGSAEQGGAINNNGSLTLENCVFQNNHATLGGAIYNIGTLQIIKSLFDSNNADKSNESYGGAIFNRLGNCTILDSVFKNNYAKKDGGAINNNQKGTLIVSNTEFLSNYANGAGAIYNSMKCNITASKFINNTASNLAGGISSTGDLEISNSLFEGNNAEKAGAVLTTGSSNVRNSTFFKNNAHDGIISSYGFLNLTWNKFLNNTAIIGAGVIGNKGILEIIHNEFINNKADNAGGAVTNYEATAKIENNTFENNSAYQGGAIHNVGLVTINGNVFNKNNASEGGAIYNNFRGTLTTVYVDILNNNFTMNTATNIGGAMFNAGNANLTNNRFIYNDILKETGYGGAIANIGRLYIWNWNYFFHNGLHRKVVGGGIANVDLGHTIINATYWAQQSRFIDSSVYNNAFLNIENGFLSTNSYDIYEDAVVHGPEEKEYLKNPENASVGISSWSHCYRHFKVDLGPFKDSVWGVFDTHMDPVRDITVHQGETVKIGASMWRENWFWNTFIGKLDKWTDSLASSDIRFRVYGVNNVDYLDHTNTDGYWNYDKHVMLDTSNMRPGTYVIQISSNGLRYPYDKQGAAIIWESSACQYAYLTILPKESG